MASHNRRKPDDSQPRGWLLLMHRLPSRPAYLRVKVWRGLRDAGAIVIRNSGYVLPRNEHTAAVLRDIVREIERGKGQAALCEAAFVDGIGEEELRSLFNKARDGDYAALEAELRKIGAAKSKRDRPGDSRARLEKISQRLQHTATIDFFGAKGRVKTESLLARLEHRFIVRDEPVVRAAKGAAAVKGKLWVTRQGIHVDRIACAWLIRRFVDPEANFKFVTDKKYRGAPGELRFDMAGAEFTHEGDNCSFETILDRFVLKDAALRAIGDVIHDLDLKDGKHARPETSGVGGAIDDICLTHRNDLDRVARGAHLLDAVYAQFKSRSGRRGRLPRPS